MDNVFTDNRVRKTGATQKLNLGGSSNNYDVYKVPLDLLYYNDQNDRIATWLSQYDVAELFVKDRKEYNNKIEEFIVASNPKTIEKTKKNIALIGQNVPGIILSDGRVIDGNRRFTCLRKINRDQVTKCGYFETIILDGNIANNKDIKILELTIQHGIESKLDYDPIDKLVGLYRDVIINKLITIKEYASSTNIELKTAEKDLRIAKLMAAFLEFVNCPNQYYLAREWDINGPLYEIDGALQKERDETRREDIKNIMFNNLLVKPDNDMTRYIRSVKNLVSDPQFGTKYLEEQLDIANEVIDTLYSKETPDSAIQEVRSNQSFIDSLAENTEAYVQRVKISKVRNQPLVLLETCETNIKDIDSKVIHKLDDDEKYEIKEKINVLLKLLNQLDDEVDV